MFLLQESWDDDTIRWAQWLRVLGIASGRWYTAHSFCKNKKKVLRLSDMYPWIFLLPTPWLTYTFLFLRQSITSLTLHCFIKFLLMIPTYWKCIIWLFLTCVSMYPLPLYNENTHCLLSSCPFIIALLRTHSCLLSWAVIWFLTQYSSLQF